MIKVKDDILNSISKNAKTMEEYKKALQLNHVIFVEITTNQGCVIIPQSIYKKLTKTQINKLLKKGAKDDGK